MTARSHAVLRVLSAAGSDGRALIERLLRRGSGGPSRGVAAQARRIVEAVRTGGDRALRDAVAAFDGKLVRRVAELRVRPALVPERALPAGFHPALERAIAAVERFHRPQVPHGYTQERAGVRLAERVLPFDRVGLYVPGGRFPYPSTVVMTVVPARLAGVGELAVVTPPQSWERSAALRHTLARLGVDEVWTMGGAHAIAALAYGTESVEAVDFIAGPGNAWVAAAKQRVAREVGVDRDAGPSEVVIVASAGAPADWLAADLLAQAEHDPRAMAVLITDRRDLAQAVAAAVSAQLRDLPTAPTARAALRARGGVLVARDLAAAFALAGRLAPEHLQVVGEDAERRAGEARAAGAVFVGAYTPVVLGDYVLGPSHVLPTDGAARTQSALGVADFVRRSHWARVGGPAPRLFSDAAALAESEGLSAHARAARLRQATRERK